MNKQGRDALYADEESQSLLGSKNPPRLTNQKSSQNSSSHQRKACSETRVRQLTTAAKRMGAPTTLTKRSART